MNDRFWPGPLLAIESSCDETAAAVLVGRTVLSNVIASQIEMHRRWGGIVPEAAARAHVEALLPVISEALSSAGLALKDLTAIAVANRPGLVGSLSVGVSAAKALAYARRLPLIGVHHIEGHLLSPFAEADVPFPHAALIVSGGHTELVVVRDLGDYEIVGQTIDDAAGEALDKSARLLGLGYPGGAAIQEQALSGVPRYALPKGLKGDTLDFSFSGFKTAVLRLTEREGSALSVPDAAASIQETLTEVLAERALRAVEELGLRALTLSGGVAANRRLRERLAAQCAQAGVAFLPAPAALCTDNAAMIGIAGSWRLQRGDRDGWGLETLPSAELP